MQQDAGKVESTQQQDFHSHSQVYSQRFKDSLSCFILDSLQREIIQPDELFPECLMTIVMSNSRMSNDKMSNPRMSCDKTSNSRMSNDIMSNPTFLFHLGTMISKLKMCYTSPLFPHTYTCTHSTIPYTLPTQDGVTGAQVAEVKGHHAVCEELRKHAWWS